MALSDCQPPGDPAVNPNTPAGGETGSLPVNPPTTGSGPANPGFILDESPPNYAGKYPRQDLESFREFCKALPTFKMIQGLIFTILANHFSDARNIISPTLRQYIWTGNDDTSSIILNIEEDWNANIIGRKPAVYLSRQDVAVQKVAINDMKQGGRADGTSEYGTMMVGSHIVKCYALSSFSPDDLAFEVGTLLIRAAPYIRNWLGLSRLQVVAIPKKDKDDKDPQEAYFVPIVVQWAFFYRWKINPESPLIKFVDIAFFR